MLGKELGKIAREILGNLCESYLEEGWWEVPIDQMEIESDFKKLSNGTLIFPAGRIKSQGIDYGMDSHFAGHLRLHGDALYDDLVDLGEQLATADDDTPVDIGPIVAEHYLSILGTLREMDPALQETYKKKFELYLDSYTPSNMAVDGRTFLSNKEYGDSEFSNTAPTYQKSLAQSRYPEDFEQPIDENYPDDMDWNAFDRAYGGPTPEQERAMETVVNGFTVDAFLSYMGSDFNLPDFANSSDYQKFDINLSPDALATDVTLDPSDRIYKDEQVVNAIAWYLSKEAEAYDCSCDPEDFTADAQQLYVNQVKPYMTSLGYVLQEQKRLLKLAGIK